MRAVGVLAAVALATATVEEAVACSMQALRGAIDVDSNSDGSYSGPMTVERFVGDLEFLGPCRFVVVGEGAVRALTSLFITPALIHIS